MLSTHVQLLGEVLVILHWNGSAIFTMADIKQHAYIKACRKFGKFSTDTLEISHQAFDIDSLG